MPGASLWIGTFHGLAHRLLRMHWREAGLPQNFQILDAEDQLRTVRKVIKALELDENRWVPREITWFINAQKDEGLRPKQIKDNGDPTRREFIRIYQRVRGGLRSARAWSISPSCCCAPMSSGATDPDLLAHYRQRFRHVLVDEFQDTNAIQYAWLRLLAGEHGPAVRRRRRRSVDLPLARRARREPAAVPARLPGTQARSGWSRTTAPPARSCRPPTR